MEWFKGMVVISMVMVLVLLMDKVFKMMILCGLIEVDFMVFYYVVLVMMMMVMIMFGFIVCGVELVFNWGGC